jgi:outer membrane protein assembly factor BamB
MVLRLLLVIVVGVLAGVTLALTGVVDAVPFEVADGDRQPEKPARRVQSHQNKRTPAPVTEAPSEEQPAVEGLLTFRGNATRTYYGEGPVPAKPAVTWTYPDTAMCSKSSVGKETKEWCGTGWTGQPAVFEKDGRTWLVVGTYDRHIHFVDADAGTPLLPPFPTGDIIKGSVSVDPDGFPLVYSGSRDDKYRILAIDGDVAREVWSLAADAVSPTMWNNDWDSSGLIMDDYLFIGGENSQFHIVKLNRGYDEDGLVTVEPELVFNAPGWDDQLLSELGDGNVSIEGSLSRVGDTVYFSNSGGLVQGWDVSQLEKGNVKRVFRFWTGDDTDATVIADDEGMLYVASQWERRNARAAEVGQIMKLDPSQPEDPLVWSVQDADEALAGVWGTPALHRDAVYVPTNAGELLGIDRMTGAVRWSKQLEGPTWSSPVVVDDVLILGDCAGTLRGWDVSDTTVKPPRLWKVSLGGCIESTPAVWRGGIYVGTRGGYIVGLR